MSTKDSENKTSTVKKVVYERTISQSPTYKIKTPQPKIKPKQK